MRIRLPSYRPTRYTLIALLVLIAIVVIDFARAFMKGGFMSLLGIAALLLCAPAMFLLAHFLGNHDIQPVIRQRNRERFLKDDSIHRFGP